tara:strand:+ start:18512 stop:18847 length:336 start_codon:yes stop_codon:yes gene_type:complete
MAAKANIVIDQGADFSTTITVTDDAGDAVALTGYTSSGQIRKHYTSNTSYAFTMSFGVDRTDGQITLSMGRALTSTIEAGRYVYDVEITSAANTRSRLVEGIATITPEVTR